MKTKIAVLGLGGVGGFIGAKLAAFYKPGGGVEVSFVARGETLEAVRRHGLKLDFLGMQTVGNPARVSDNPSDLGEQDFLICAVKAYDLDRLVESLKPAVGTNTVIIPFLNGLEGTEKLKNAFPQNLVADGCVFIVSKIKAPGEIFANMEKYSYMFGSSADKSGRLEKFESLVRDAGVRATCTRDIERVAWEKFAYISPISTLMSYVQKPFGEMFSDENNVADLKALLDEFREYATAKGANLPADVYDITWKKFEAMPADFTTSMQRDFAAHKASELETITGYVLRGGQSMGLRMPTYSKYYELLK